MGEVLKTVPSVKLDWQTTEEAVAYRASRTAEKFKRFHREDTILAEWMGDLPPGSIILDSPCGAGRWIPFLTSHKYRYIGGDVSEAMLGQARVDLTAGRGDSLVNLDAEHLPFADESVDCVIIWRFLHHLATPEARVQILREAARVTRRKVILSFHHPLSLTYLRKLADRILIKKSGRGRPVSHWRLRREADKCGLNLLETKSFRKFVSINWFACLEKRKVTQ